MAKKRNVKGMGSIRKRNNGYEGRVTVKVNGISKQISIYSSDKRILAQEMIEAKQKSEEERFVQRNNITLEDWLKKWIYIYKKPFVKARTTQGYIEKIKFNILPFLR